MGHDRSVSVIIPAFNAIRSLKRAVTSATSSCVVLEIIVVDDGSTDATVAMANGLAAVDPRIKLVQHSGGQNLGSAASRNLGISVATCPYIAFLDADDYFLSNRFDSSLNLLANDPNLDGIYGWQTTVFEDLTKQADFLQRYQSLSTGLSGFKEPEEIFRALIELVPRSGHIHLNTLTLKRRALDQLDYHFNHNLKRHDDSEFMARLAFFCRLTPTLSTEPIAVRVVHDANKLAGTRIGSPDFFRYKLAYWSSLYQWASHLKNYPTRQFLWHFRKKILQNQIGLSKSILRHHVLRTTRSFPTA